MASNHYSNLTQVLEGKGYTIVTCQEASDITLRSYRDYMAKGDTKPLIDTRCPKIISIINQDFPELKEYLAPIHPILITCAHQLYNQHVKPNPLANSLTLVTPCTELVEYGQSIFEKDVNFVTWKEFVVANNLGQSYPKASSSPIPLGFFDTLEIPIAKASGQREVYQILRRLIHGRLPTEIKLLELLYCQDGCHNGDGF